MLRNEYLNDNWSCLMCGHCEHFKVNADMQNIESTCKRLDHKILKFAKPWFKSYDCGQFNSCVCRDFKPAKWCVWLYKHWTNWDDYYGEDGLKGYVWIVVNNNFDVRYRIKREDFVNGTFMDGNQIKTDMKMYYKRTTKSPTGYELVCEKIDGVTIQNE